MARALSIHIGVNAVDPSHYPPLPTLIGPPNDMNDMATLARTRGFAVRATLLNAQATAQRVLDELHRAADDLEPDGTLLLTFSGHGSVVPNDDGSGPAGHDPFRDDGERDQTWCLFDRQLIDDELYAEWRRFRPGVRVLVVSDSCYSGSMLGLAPAATVRGLTIDEARATFVNNAATYRAIEADHPKGRCVTIDASVTLLGACRDCEPAFDGPHGKFTEALLAVWNGGTFTDSLVAFHEAIYRRVAPIQRPTLTKVGAPQTRFDLDPPFTI